MSDPLGLSRLRDRYEGSAFKAFVLAPTLSSLLALGYHCSRIVAALIVADVERAGGSRERWDLLNEHLLSLLTLGTLQQYLVTLVLAGLGTLLLLAPAVWLCLDRRWPTSILRLMAGVFGLLPFAAITVRVLWAGVSGPPITGLTTIFGALCNGLIPLMTVSLFLRFLRPLETLEKEDLRMDATDADRLPFLAHLSPPRGDGRRDGGGKE